MRHTSMSQVRVTKIECLCPSGLSSPAHSSRAYPSETCGVPARTSASVWQGRSIEEVSSSWPQDASALSRPPKGRLPSKSSISKTPSENQSAPWQKYRCSFFQQESKPALQPQPSRGPARCHTPIHQFALRPKNQKILPKQT